MKVVITCFRRCGKSETASLEMKSMFWKEKIKSIPQSFGVVYYIIFSFERVYFTFIRAVFTVVFTSRAEQSKVEVVEMKPGIAHR